MRAEPAPSQRAETYVDSGAFEADSPRRVAVRTESQKFPDAKPSPSATAISTST